MPIDPDLMNAAAEFDGEANADTLAIRQLPPAPPEPALKNDDVLRAALKSANVILERVGDHWMISDIEIEQLVLVWTPVLEKYFPDFQMSIEFAAISTTIVIAAPKYFQHEKLRKDKLDAEKRTTEKGQPSRVSPSNERPREITPHQKPQPVDEKTSGDNLGSPQRSQPEPVPPDEHATAILQSANLPE